MFKKLLLVFGLLFSTLATGTSLATTTVAKPELVKLTEDNFVVLRGPINGQSSSKFITDLLDKKSKDLYVYLNTGGGSITGGMQIIQTLKALELAGTTVNCITNVGLSMGFVITQYCQNRLVIASSILMQHQASFSAEGPVNNVNSYVDFIHSMVNEIDVHQAHRMNMTLKDFKEKVRDDWWLIGSEAVKHGAADKLVYVLCDFKNQLVKEKIDTIFGEVTVTYSKCPLAKDPQKIEFGRHVENSDKERILDDIVLDKVIDKHKRKNQHSNTNILLF
jgi:ATP-dependent Clp protease protease subunit